MNFTDGDLTRSASALSRAVQMVGGTSSKLGFHGAAPTAQRANTHQAEATDLASVITLANELRAALAEKGLIKGGP